MSRTAGLAAVLLSAGAIVYGVLYPDVVSSNSGAWLQLAKEAIVQGQQDEPHVHPTQHQWFEFENSSEAAAAGGGGGAAGGDPPGDAKSAPVDAKLSFSPSLRSERAAAKAAEKAGRAEQKAAAKAQKSGAGATAPRSAETPSPAAAAEADPLVPAAHAAPAASAVECDKGTVVTPFEFGGAGNGRRDDTQAIRDTIAYGSRCKATAVIGPSGKEFLMMPGHPLSVHQVTIRIEGKILGPDLQTWNPSLLSWPPGSCAYRGAGGKAAAAACSAPGGPSPEYERSRYALLHLVNSSDVTIDGPGFLVANGRTFWTVRNKKPHVRGYGMLKIERSVRVIVSNLRVVDSPMYQVAIVSSAFVYIEKMKQTISDDQLDFNGPHNTDGINILNSTQVTVRDCVLDSGDDNLVIKEGSSAIDVQGVVLRRGKGLSIGSLGERQADGQVVRDVYIADVKVQSSMNGVRIKTWSGSAGLVRNVTFARFKLESVLQGVEVDQTYCPRTQKSEGCGTPSKDSKSVKLQQIRFVEFKGTYTKKAKVTNCVDCTGVDLAGVVLTRTTDRPVPRDRPAPRPAPKL